MGMKLQEARQGERKGTGRSRPHLRVPAANAGEELQVHIPAPAECLCSLGEGERKGTGWGMFSPTTRDSDAG